jgi:hypothetical protein
MVQIVLLMVLGHGRTGVVSTEGLHVYFTKRAKVLYMTTTESHENACGLQAACGPRCVTLHHSAQTLTARCVTIQPSARTLTARCVTLQPSARTLTACAALFGKRRRCFSVRRLILASIARANVLLNGRFGTTILTGEHRSD